MMLGEIPIGTYVTVKCTSTNKNILIFETEIIDVLSHTIILISPLKNCDDKYYNFENWTVELYVKNLTENGEVIAPIKFNIDNVNLVVRHGNFYNKLECKKSSSRVNLRSSARIAVKAEVQLQLDSDVYQGITDNISCTGVGLTAELDSDSLELDIEKLSVDNKIVLGITFPGKPCYHVNGTIKRLEVNTEESTAFLGCQFDIENLNINREIQKLQSQN